MRVSTLFYLFFMEDVYISVQVKIADLLNW